MLYSYEGAFTEHPEIVLRYRVAAWSWLSRKLATRERERNYFLRGPLLQDSLARLAYPGATRERLPTGTGYKVAWPIEPTLERTPAM